MKNRKSKIKCNNTLGNGSILYGIEIDGGWYLLNLSSVRPEWSNFTSRTRTWRNETFLELLILKMNMVFFLPSSSQMIRLFGNDKVKDLLTTR